MVIVVNFLNIFALLELDLPEKLSLLDEKSFSLCELIVKKIVVTLIMLGFDC